MLATILKSRRATEATFAIIETFAQLPHREDQAHGQEGSKSLKPPAPHSRRGDFGACE